jgi:gamma-glutamyl hydrolase
MIGIIAFPELNTSNSLFPTNYVDWVESSGAKAVVLPYTISPKQLLHCLDQLSGLVWTGGSIETPKYSSLQYDTYMNTLQLSFDIIQSYNDEGRHFPLWGICLGFEILVLLGKKTKLPTLFNHIQHHPKKGKECISFTKESSRLKDWFDKDMRDKMEHTPCAYHHHHLGFDIIPMKHLILVSTNSGFINMIEYKKYPFYGVQFHPDQPFNSFSRKVSHQLSCFLKHELKLNKNN